MSFTSPQHQDEQDGQERDERAEQERAEQEQSDRDARRNEAIVGRPILAGGDASPHVHELGALLAAQGYESSTSRGENPFGTVDESLIGAVRQYAGDHLTGDEYEGDRREIGAGRVPLSVWAQLAEDKD